MSYKDVRAAAHKSQADKKANMLKGHSHADEREDKSLVKRMVKKDALTGKANGGSTKKPKAALNIIVAPGKSGAAPVPGGRVPSPSPSAQAAPPPARPPMGGGLSALGNMPPNSQPMPPRAGPAQFGAKKGGAVKRRADGGSVSWLKSGAGSGEGRLEKEKHSKRKA